MNWEKIIDRAAKIVCPIGLALITARCHITGSVTNLLMVGVYVWLCAMWVPIFKTKDKK